MVEPADRQPSPLATDDPLAVAVTGAIRSGDVPALVALLDTHLWLATARLGDPSAGVSRTLLHVATDWPGHFPRVGETIRALVAAGADPTARCAGQHTETPLHWAASSDDLEALDALLDCGADVDADGAVIAGGTPLTDATAFGQWEAARRLLTRGATAGLWEAACLGLLDRLRSLTRTEPAPTSDEITGCFWGACHGGQLATARHLLTLGADPTWIGWDDLTPAQAARRSEAADVVRWLEAEVLPRHP